MTIINTIDWTNVASAATLLVLVVGFVAWVVRAEGRSRANTLMADQAAKKADDLGRELQQHKIDSAKEFATWEALNRFDDRFTKAIDRLGDQIVEAIAGRNSEPD